MVFKGGPIFVNLNETLTLHILITICSICPGKLIHIVFANSIDIHPIRISGPKPTGPSTTKIQEDRRKE